MKNNNLIQNKITEREFNLHPDLADFGPVISRILSSRGITNKKQISYKLCSLAPISSLNNIDEAIEILLKYKKDKIVIVGDYDVDGATSVSLLIRCLGEFGFENFSYIVPNRMKDGYGLTPSVVDEAKKRYPKLIVTVDNGISSFKGIDEARKHGIDVLVTDHHLPGQSLPNANVILNPNLFDSKFKSPHLAGIGVAFYLMAGLAKELERQGMSNARKIPLKFLDLVALGTIADVVKLDFNNRVLVDRGLKIIRNGDCVKGIQSLIEKSGKNYKKLTSQDLGFSIAPKINASGRLDDISIGIECLLTDDKEKANKYSDLLINTNTKRKEIQKKMSDEASNYVKKFKKNELSSCICVYDKNWHQGLVGLIASKLKEEYNRPVFAFAYDDNDTLKGSGRSVSGIHIRDLLESISNENPNLIIKFGGHAMAAGLSINEVDYNSFRASVSQHIDLIYPDYNYTGEIQTDGVLLPDQLSLNLANRIQEFGPWGTGFEEPKFHGKFHIHDQRVVGGYHLKMQVQPVDGKKIIDAIAFNQQNIITREAIGFIYKLDVNEFRGKITEQLVVDHILQY